MRIIKNKKCSIETWKRDWISPSDSSGQSGRERFSNEENDLVTSKELNKKSYKMKISRAVQLILLLSYNDRCMI